MQGYIGTKYDMPTKQEVLLFDQICMGQMLVNGFLEKQPERYADLVYLIEKGIVELIPRAQELPGLVLLEDNELFKSWSQFVPQNPLNLKEDEGFRLIDETRDYLSRVLALTITKNYNLDATPIIKRFPYNKNSTAQRSNIAKIAIESLPMPSDDIPWEQIIDFKKDPATKQKFLELKKWTRKLVNENTTISDTYEELEYLLSDYKSHLELHRLKTHKGRLQAFVSVPISIVENLVKFSPSKAAESVLTISQDKIQLMEAELEMPSREVAYIVHAQERFAR